MRKLGSKCKGELAMGKFVDLWICGCADVRITMGNRLRVEEIVPIHSILWKTAGKRWVSSFTLL